MTSRILLRHPAGSFFALAGGMALALPWIWLLPLDDAAMAHRRLGIFGFAGGAVVGYVLTALPAWTSHRPPLRLTVLLLLWLAARAAGLVVPSLVWPALLPQMLLGLAILWPVVLGRVWHRAGLAAAPLIMGLAEYGSVTGMVSPRGLGAGLGLLILLVGGRAVPAFLRAEAERDTDQTAHPPGPLWPLGLLWPVVLVGPLPSRLAAALAFGGLVLARIATARHAGGANRMLALGWAMLAPAALALALTGAGPEALAADHVLLIAAMGGTVLAFAARASMQRAKEGGLRPHRLHWLAFWLVLAAAPLRGLAALPAGTGVGLVWLGLAGATWSLGWVMFLAVHLAALPRQTPFPVLSGVRRPQMGQTAGHSPPSHGQQDLPSGPEGGRGIADGIRRRA